MARIPTIAVVDASVVVKWFKDEASTLEALALRDNWAAGRVSLHIAAYPTRNPQKN